MANKRIKKKRAKIKIMTEIKRHKRKYYAKSKKITLKELLARMDAFGNM